ncbi:MAG: DUF805 domain-containing protein [Alphaproteobacteria bacterium]|nr:DUF805 domain-containing protein [Alphaproteobacteria bacterium]
MSFPDSIKTCLVEKPFTFKGRASRSEFWWFFLFFYLCIGLLGALLEKIGFGRKDTVTIIGVIALLIPMLYLLIVYLSVTVRRLHDASNSGWNILLRLIPYVGEFIVLYMLCKKGDEWDNDYGPNPLNRGQDVLQNPDEQSNDVSPQQPEASSPSQPNVDSCPVISQTDGGDKEYTSSYLNSISWQEWNNLMAKELNEAGFRRRNTFSSNCEMVEYEAPDDYPKGFILGAVDGYEEIEFLKKRRLLNNGRCPMCGKAITVPGTFTSGFDHRMSFQICQSCARNHGRVIDDDDLGINETEPLPLSSESKQYEAPSSILKGAEKPNKKQKISTRRKVIEWIVFLIFAIPIGYGSFNSIKSCHNAPQKIDNVTTWLPYEFNNAFRMSIPSDWKFDAMSCPKYETSSASNDITISYHADFDRGQLMFVPLGSNVSDNFVAGVFVEYRKLNAAHHNQNYMTSKELKSIIETSLYQNMLSKNGLQIVDGSIDYGYDYIGESRTFEYKCEITDNIDVLAYQSYALWNFDEVVSITVGYNKTGLWEFDCSRIVDSFKWVNPK